MNLRRKAFAIVVRFREVTPPSSPQMPGPSAAGSSTNLNMLSTIKQEVRVTTFTWTLRSRESSGNSDRDRRSWIFHKCEHIQSPIKQELRAQTTSRALETVLAEAGDSTFCTKMQTAIASRDRKYWWLSRQKGRKARNHCCPHRYRWQSCHFVNVSLTPFLMSQLESATGTVSNKNETRRFQPAAFCHVSCNLPSRTSRMLT